MTGTAEPEPPRADDRYERGNWYRLMGNPIRTQVMQLPQGCLVRTIEDYGNADSNTDGSAVAITYVPGAVLADFGVSLGPA